MTAVPPFVTPSVQMVPPSRHPRLPRDRTAWVGFLVTGLGVATGLALVTSLAPRPPTPGNVARAFIEARFEQDWAAMWPMLCRPDRAGIDAAQFARRMAYADSGFEAPDAVVVRARNVTEVVAPTGVSFTVEVRATTLEPHAPGSSSTVELPVVAEDGGFRVCPGAGRATGP